MKLINAPGAVAKKFIRSKKILFVAHIGTTNASIAVGAVTKNMSQGFISEILILNMMRDFED